jgi:hypothetical protein
MKVCIVTTAAAAAEPRAMKQAVALKARWPHLSVSLCDAVPRGAPTPDPAGLAQASIVRRRLQVPTRQRGAPELAVRKAGVALARTRFRRSGTLSQEYVIERPTAFYNTPAIEADLPAKNAEFSLYWRNYQIGFGQRGLDDALVALSQVPGDIKLYLQGRPPHDGGSALAARLTELDVAERVIVKAPFAAGGAVREAAPHSVGLCLERSGPLNHELTVSNKMFDYLMAGLVVIASDLPGLRTIIERSGGGLLYTPGSPDSLAAAICRLHKDRGLLSTLSGKARAYALEVGNEDVDMKAFTDAMSGMLRLDAG